MSSHGAHARVAYRVAEAAEATGVSVDVIRRALRTTKADCFPPPLDSVRNGEAPNAARLILADDLRDWIARFPR